jgi:hypothetical protein
MVPSRSTQQVANSRQINFSCLLFSELELHRLGQVLKVILLEIFLRRVIIFHTAGKFCVSLSGSYLESWSDLFKIMCHRLQVELIQFNLFC